MDTIDPATGAATEKTETASSNGSGTVAPEKPQGDEQNAGGEQSFSESGKVDGTDTPRPQFRSKNQTIYELRQRLRERDAYWDSEVGTLKTQLAQLQKMLTGEPDRKPSRTFYDAPEDTLRALLKESLEPLKENILGEFRQSQEEREQAQALKQEALEAAKFIRSQKSITEDEIQEIRELLQTDEVAQSLGQSPMKQAKYVMYLWNQERGIADKSDLKNRARSITGASVSTGNGPRTWTEADMKAEADKLGPVKDWGPEQKKKFKELETEFMKAYADGRVKK